jgi:hypothetical protein
LAPAEPGRGFLLRSIILLGLQACYSLHIIIPLTFQ